MLSAAIGAALSEYLVLSQRDQAEQCQGPQDSADGDSGSKQRRERLQRRWEVGDDCPRGAKTVCRLLPRLALFRPRVNALSPLRSHLVIAYALPVVV